MSASLMGQLQVGKLASRGHTTNSEVLDLIGLCKAEFPRNGWATKPRGGE